MSPAPAPCSPPPSAAGVRRFVHVSSLAAREPQLSLYGASQGALGSSWSPPRRSTGRSSARRRSTAPATANARTVPDGERAASSCSRPPAGCRCSTSTTSPGCCSRSPCPALRPSVTIEPDDGRPGGWTHREFGERCSARRSAARFAPCRCRASLLRAAARARPAGARRRRQADPRPRRLFLPSRLGRRPGPRRSPSSCGSQRSRPRTASQRHRRAGIDAQGWL